MSFVEHHKNRAQRNTQIGYDWIAQTKARCDINANDCLQQTQPSDSCNILAKVGCCSYAKNKFRYVVSCDGIETIWWFKKNDHIGKKEKRHKNLRYDLIIMDIFLMQNMLRFILVEFWILSACHLFLTGGEENQQNIQQFGSFEWLIWPEPTWWHHWAPQFELPNSELKCMKAN